MTEGEVENNYLRFGNIKSFVGLQITWTEIISYVGMIKAEPFLTLPTESQPNLRDLSAS